MRVATYQLSINGFSVTRETYDDMLEWDGKRDEVYIEYSTAVASKDGSVQGPFFGRSATMGDINNMNGRIAAGSASNMGGLRTGDSFPHSQPWEKRWGGVEPSTARNYPPMITWQGQISENDAVFFVPTIWEWDLGTGLPRRFIEWTAAVNSKFGEKAKDLFSQVYPPNKVIFPIVDLSIQTIDFAADVSGTAGTRPVGLAADKSFSPKVFAFTLDRAEKLLQTNPSGRGLGIVELNYDDAAGFEGSYVLYCQIERIGAVQDTGTGGGGVITIQSNWRWCNDCQGLFFGPHQAGSSCPAGGTHASQAQSQSGNYSLAHNIVADAGRQSEWRWCNKCQSLFFGPNVGASKCSAGLTHAPPSVSGSGNYTLFHNAPASPTNQREWRWCNKCQSLFFGPNVAASVCAAGGTHAPPSQSGSGNYSLSHSVA